MKCTLHKWAFALMLLSTICLSNAATIDTSQNWQTLAPGLAYKKLSNFATFPNGTIHAFQIDPKHYNFDIALTNANNHIRPPYEMMKQQYAAIAVNGGFFSPEMKSLGLRISKSNELNPIKSISWWNIFFIKNDKAYITSQKNYVPDTNISFAIQAGPRLVADGIIPQLKPGVDSRTALGIQASGKIILIVTENLLLSTQQLAEIMRRPERDGGLNCTNALNLDGGASTQLYTQLNNLSLFVNGLSKVADIILIIPKEQTKP